VVQQPAPARPAAATNPYGNASLVAIGPDDALRRLTQRLQLAQAMLARYDGDENQKLTRSEMKLEKKEFESLDSNKDGELDQVELAQWLRRAPDVELLLRLGKTSDSEPAIDTVSASAKTVEVRKVPGGVYLVVDDGQITLRRAETQQSSVDRIRQFTLQQFKAAAGDKKDFIEMNDITQGNLRFYLQGPLQMGDRDGDGKLTEKELTEFLDLQAASAMTYSSLTVNEQGRAFFELLDANKDGRLGLRELRSIWERLAVYDKEKSGTVDKTILPRQFQATMALGQSAFGRTVFVLDARGGGMPRRPEADLPGPAWFRKMDRNGDGDVSLREWLGPASEFHRLDRDSDGLVSVREAEEADAEARKRAGR
jgi:Ca2+-binding EF-hand superfamily protein